MTLLRDLITIPERVHQGDFVLQLSKGVTEPEQTLRDYVVTPQLVDAFANALGFIQQAVQTGGSKAAYLHGSFGSGKSHFMAVLNLLLAGNTQARATPELADVVARHGWADGRKFLLVPYHMIGARDMESAILGQYAEFVRKKHPGAPVPGFYLAEGMFKDARDLRERMGDEAFFAKLNEGASSGGDGGWGAFESGWDAVAFDAAMREAPNGEERSRLVGDLITQFFSAYRTLAGSGESFVSLDDGLSIMSRHAKALGYDAVILFLDELVLWLASHAADVNFVSREGAKLVKLVEATNADRPIPLISFVARQRDLRDLVGENLAGSVQVQFSDVLKHWEARFHRITLEDRNLPAIAEKRVLRPVDEAARQALQGAFDGVLNIRTPGVVDTLLTTTADRDMFRKVYPFSPALVQTLIAVSAALQRERTALKLMLQLLVDRRADLELGQLIPVGDLYDAIAEGDEPFSEGMRLHFENAKRLYNQRLLPMLERQHNVTWEAIKLGQADAVAAKNLRNDARLLKTLLLGALVPEVESLKALSAQRLAALNHGTFRSPIPGREAQDVLRKCRDWASEIGEIKITEDQNPIISIQVTGVDIEPILRAAEANDNPGNRRKRIREALFKELEIVDTGDLFNTYEFNWRGTRREVELLYENVREMTDDRLRGRSGTWTVVLDFPFDDANFGPPDDLARLAAYRGGDTKTLVWIPSFLSNKALADLGRLVVLDYILQGERFETYAGHLSFVDRVQAKALARNQLDQLRIKLRSQLEVAYGISPEPRDAVSSPLTADQQFRSLDLTLSPRPPVGADFKSAFENLLGQLFAHQYPAHPEFDTEIKPAVIRKIWPEVQKAIEAPGQRGLVQDTGVRKLVRSVVNPCQLGQMAETHLLIEPHWQSRFLQSHARDSGGPITVAKLRQWIDMPAPMGLPLELQNLIILAFAASTSRRFTMRGGPFAPSVDSMPDELELREQSLPSAGAWQLALQRASSLFGLTLGQTLNAANVGKLVDDVKQRVGEKRDAVTRLVVQVRDRAGRYAAGASGARRQTAESAQSLLAAVTSAADSELVAVLAGADLQTSEAAVGRALGQAKACADALESGSYWQLFDVVLKLSDHRAGAAQVIGRRLAEVLTSDEHVLGLKERLDELHRDAMALLAEAAPAPAPGPGPAPVPAPGTPAPAPVTIPPVPAHLAPEVVAEKQQLHLSGAQAVAALEELKARITSERDLELTLSWRLQRKGTQP
ncbi:phage resistance protein [Verminephrobacter eiseniae]|uniref:phage resistance protein n=1 Tax=Verminephrobacter eiseniae TaxID=364317 RepID=UPI002237886C|nr:phage resistance protein [Verminephrobacter eiseniae]MCW5238064.1 phage resistance protein [Verminephrobacter eiseniae]